jgi:hypothetical protein
MGFWAFVFQLMLLGATAAIVLLFVGIIVYEAV